METQPSQPENQRVTPQTRTRTCRYFSRSNTRDEPMDCLTAFVMFLIFTVFLSGLLIAIYGRGAIGANVVNVVAPIILGVGVIAAVVKGTQYLCKKQGNSSNQETELTHTHQTDIPRNEIESPPGYDGVISGLNDGAHNNSAFQQDNHFPNLYQMPAGESLGYQPFPVDAPPKYEDIVKDYNVQTTLPHATPAANASPGTLPPNYADIRDNISIIQNINVVETRNSESVNIRPAIPTIVVDSAVDIPAQQMSAPVPGIAQSTAAVVSTVASVTTVTSTGQTAVTTSPVALTTVETTCSSVLTNQRAGDTPTTSVFPSSSSTSTSIITVQTTTSDPTPK